MNEQIHERIESIREFGGTVVVGERIVQVHPVEEGGYRYRWESDGLGKATDQRDAFPTLQKALLAARKEEAARTGEPVLERVTVSIPMGVPDDFFK